VNYNKRIINKKTGWTPLKKQMALKQINNTHWNIKTTGLSHFNQIQIYSNHRYKNQWPNFYEINIHWKYHVKQRKRLKIHKIFPFVPGEGGDFDRLGGDWSFFDCFGSHAAAGGGSGRPGLPWNILEICRH